MPDSADPLTSLDPDMPPRKPLAPGGGKLKKPLTEKQRAAAEQRLAHLRAHLLLRPLESPAAGAPPLPPPHEAALRALGLLDFARLDLHSDAPRPDLVAPLVAYYDPVCKRSFVRGVRVAVSRSDLARALSLPPKPAAAAAAPPDVDPAAVAPAVLQLLQDYVLLPFQGDDMCILPQEVAAAEKAVREGLAHRVDWAGLIWGLVEKELLELPKRDDGVCYFWAHLQRLIWAQKPKLFEAVDGGERGEAVPEASVDGDVEMGQVDGDDDADTDVKSKSLEELELGDAEADVYVRGKSLEESELGNADVRSDGLDEMELGQAVTRNKVLEELGLGDADARNNKEELEVVDEDARGESLDKSESVEEDVRSKNLDEPEALDEEGRSKNLDELEAVDEDGRSKNLDELEAVDEDGKVTSLDESGMIDDESGMIDGHVNGTILDGSGLGSVAVEAVSAEVMPDDKEDEGDVERTEGDDVAGASEEDSEEPLVETVVVTQEEVVAVAEEVGDEEADGEEENDAMGLSLGFNSANGYDSMDVEEETHIENLDEGDSDNEEAEESEDDGFEGVNGGQDLSWRIGDGSGDGNEDEEMTHSLQRCNTFGGMEFENLNKGEAEMRDELGFDDFSVRGSLERMTSSNLLQAMNSIPSSYNITENVHGLSGEFLSMGADAHKSGVDMEPGSSYLFGNNGKRHIGDIDGYNGNMQAQEQFPQCNQQKRMRHSNSSSISTGSGFFNANFSVPIQNMMAEASRLYEQKEQELQTLQFEKQRWSDMLQQKDAVIQTLNSTRFEQQNKYQAELRRFEHDLNVMAQLVTGYKKALKQTQASFEEYRKKFPCNKPLYGDVTGGGGLVLSVSELERMRFEEERQKLAAANAMVENFQNAWFLKLDEWTLSINSLWSRMEGLYKEIDLLKEYRRAKFATPSTEE